MDISQFGEILFGIVNGIDTSNPWRGFMAFCVFVLYTAFLVATIMIPFRIGGIREDIRKIRKAVEKMSERKQVL